MAMPTIRLEMDLQDLGRPQPDAKPEQPSLIPAESPACSILAATIHSTNRNVITDIMPPACLR
jgi:hypothetical protein